MAKPMLVTLPAAVVAVGFLAAGPVRLGGATAPTGRAGSSGRALAALVLEKLPLVALRRANA